MRPFARIRGDKGKLPRLMPRPARPELDQLFQGVNAGELGQLEDPAGNPPARTDPAEDRDYGHVSATDQQYRENDPHGLGPVTEFGQDDRVEHQHEINRRHQTMQSAEYAIG